MPALSAIDTGMRFGDGGPVLAPGSARSGGQDPVDDLEVAVVGVDHRLGASRRARGPQQRIADPGGGASEDIDRTVSSITARGWRGLTGT